MEWTRNYYDSALPAVFSTPAMIGLMEGAAARAVETHLPAGTFTVGTHIDVEHLKAAPVGAHIVVTAKLAKMHGRFLFFDVEARNGETVLGKGRITHAIVSLEKFGQLASLDSPPSAIK
jgi:fluoroacetyl-CoA thioesterase